MKTKKLLWLFCLGVFLIVPSVSHAVTDLYVASYGGSFEDALKQKLDPIFEKKFNCKIHHVIGISAQTLAKVRIEKDNPQVDVAILDNGPSFQGTNEGLWANLDPKIVTNLENLYPIALHPNNNGVDMGVIAVGIGYNTQIFKEKGIAAPSSWNDLLKPELKQRVVIETIASGYGLTALMMLARSNGGSEKDIEPGFVKMKELKKSVVEFSPTSAKTSELFQSKEAWIGVTGNTRVYPLQDTGFPIDFAYPKEGAVFLGVSINAVKNSKNLRLAQEFINFMLSEEAQEVYAKMWSLGPMNKNLKLSPEAAKKCAYGPDVAKLLKVDWSYINEHRPAWSERWMKEVESN
jgi:putative spermidine/putrescine transport system substrate-binding protein